VMLSPAGSDAHVRAWLVVNKEPDNIIPGRSGLVSEVVLVLQIVRRRSLLAVLE
jgi:hypothetical protein